MAMELPEWFCYVTIVKRNSFIMIERKARDRFDEEAGFNRRRRALQVGN